MKRLKTITLDKWLKKKDTENPESSPSLPESTNIETSPVPESHPKRPRLENNAIDLDSLERDPAKRPQIWEYPVNQRDEVRRAYINFGPHQPLLEKYESSGKHNRSFQYSWFALFPSWLEYSESIHRAFCLPCFLFNKPSGHSGEKAFTVDGFHSWKKVRDGRNCAFLNHMGKDFNSTHRIAVRSCEDLMRQSQHIEKSFDKQSSQQIADNRLRVKLSVEAIRFLALQGCAFRGHDERPDSVNPGNFKKLLDLLALYNEDVAKVLNNGPHNATYTSPVIQKQIIRAFSVRVRKSIRDEIGYYVHCMAHRLQLALVAAARDVIPVYQFFDKLTTIVNIVGASPKRHDNFQNAQAEENEYLTSIDELETGRGLNQIETLPRAGDTCWSSHYRSVTRLRNNYSSAVTTVLDILEGDGNSSQKCDAATAYDSLISYEFVFILHLVEDMLEITNELCKDLQFKSQDILNAIRKVSATKVAIQKMRDDGWDSLIAKVNAFCQKRDIDIPDLNARYVKRRGRARGQQDNLTLQHYYQVEIFYAAIDTQLQKLNSRFNEHALELLTLSSALDPREMRIEFKIDNVCHLVEKFYSNDFAEHEKLQLKLQLELYGHEVVRDKEFEGLSTISDLSQWLVRTRRSTNYPLVYRLIQLVLTLPVSTTTIERAFSAMRIIKTRLRSRMGDDFLTNTLLMYIEKEITESFSIDSIIDDFRNIQTHKILF